jgi:hypothetical protein
MQSRQYIQVIKLLGASALFTDSGSLGLSVPGWRSGFHGGFSRARVFSNFVAIADERTSSVRILGFTYLFLRVLMVARCSSMTVNLSLNANDHLVR